MIDDFISIGKITAPFGLKGHLKVAVSGDILNSLKAPVSLFIHSQSQFKPCSIIEILHHKQGPIVLIKGFEDINLAEKLCGEILYFPKKEADALVSGDEFFEYQLIGLVPYEGEKVFSEFKVQSIIDNPVHPILSFKSDSQEILVPYISRYVGKVDLIQKKIEVFHWEDWFIED